MFGAFRVLGQEVELDLPEAAIVSDLRVALQPKVSGMELDELLALSKFANVRVVLADTASLDATEVLAILPPVSGG
ncbi:MAG: hypothetical protein COA47_01620 [Robiginitomaculum sp.]|nr:MAG: hypothetical protein COA47_01620 [Robiginitomaculum sp.]